ncbi:ABC transporter ATP-binding protein [Cellulomonas sp. PhB143]|uniref:ABC transporter ATP-binding protein n=1 Tax=Cellulomonas sp. PhB143 TaxID=2485186 RepID=UPI000FBE4AD9|nr:ABC transporter ATP-binding protein [Cellulomonas sp. PhB143]ROS76483.1 putative ABC transport system ATP-binding protein/lipoprotein-releasing system ATP-binding protein [Cellulomonas sp. PhB143]
MIAAVGLSSAALDVEGLTATLGRRPVLTGVDLQVAGGRSVAVMGDSGSGKSTLLNCILGLVRPTGGSVSVCGQQVRSGLSSRAARQRRRSVGVVFQSGHLLPELDPVENVALAGLLAGLRPQDAARRARALLDRLGIDCSSRSVLEYSGGERQRIAVARALINEPPLLIADEPTGSLDPTNRDTVSDLLFTLPATVGCALVVVTHDPVVASRAESTYRLTDGRLVTEAGLTVSGRA